MMTHIWRRSLAAQFITMMLLALLVSQAIGFLISWDERGQALRAAAKGEFFSRTASLARLLETTPADIQDDVLSVSGTSYTRFWVSPAQPSDPTAWSNVAWAQLAKPLPMFKPGHPMAPGAVGTPVASAILPPIGTAIAAEAPRWVDLSASAWSLSRPAMFLRLDEANGMGLSVRLENGAWLNAVFAKSVQNSLWTSQSALSLAITAIVLSSIGILVARSIARPMRRLAEAAEALGRGEPTPPLPESGPDDIRKTAESFNRMRDRLQRFVEDRTRMLAAIGHDMRTPLTSLRLRAEFVADPDNQDKMLKTIDEIQTMTEAALAFAREEAAAEATRTVELTALVESLCDDLTDLGWDVTFEEGPKVNYRCRPDALRRAIRNLIENAIRYGKRARVGVRSRADGIHITVNDDGPGIPDTLREQVFVPFFRLEDSRNRETGGVGLGLSIVRTIARHHGGDANLRNLDKGLSATISLPKVG